MSLRMMSRFFIAILLLASILTYGQGQPRKLTLAGEVLVQDDFGTKGQLTVTINGTKLQGSATYPPKKDQYVSMADIFEGELDKDNFIEGKATRKVRQALVEVGSGGLERPLAFVEFQEIGRFQGRFKDGTLEVEGRFFKFDRNQRYEIVDAAKAKFVVDPHRKFFENQKDKLTFFKWAFPKKQK